MFDLASTLAGSLLLVVTALAVVATLRIRGRAPFVIATLVVAAAAIVALVEVLSLFDALTRPGILIGQVVLAGIALAAWLACGRPRPPAIGRIERRVLADAARAHPAVALLLVIVGAALLVELVLAVKVAPNNWDSMTYHLARAGYWIQHGNALQWHGGSVRQLTSPPNAEMLLAWTLSLRGSDQLAAVVQWTALIGTGAAIFSIARLIAFPIAPAAFAAGLFVAMPQPVLQATSTQNDLVTACFILATIVFAVRSLRDRSLGDLAIAATAIGLAIGTKGTTLLALPSLGLAIGYAAWRFRPPRRFVALACALCACGVLAFGAFEYVQNVRSTGTLFGPLKHMVERTSPLRGNAGRVAWTFADSPGLNVPWLASLLARPSHLVFGDLDRPGFTPALNTLPQEDYAAFGLLGLLVVVPILVVTAIRPRSPPWRRVFALASLGYIAAFAVANEWNPWIGRLLVPGVAIGAPLLAIAARRWLSWAVLAVALVGLVPTLFANKQKPLPSVFALDRLHQQTLSRGEMFPVLVEINKRVGRVARLGFVGSEDSWDYPLLGRHRAVIQLDAASVTAGVMATEGLTAVLFANVPPPSPPLVFRTIADGYYLVMAREQWR